VRGIHRHNQVTFLVSRQPAGPEALLLLRLRPALQTSSSDGIALN